MKLERKLALKLALSLCLFYSGLTYAEDTKPQMAKDHQMMMEHMDMMANNLKNKTGDAFDRQFLHDMIMHHEGAVKMARVAQTNARHEELKKKAAEMMETQAREINQMRQWQKEWGYEK